MNRLKSKIEFSFGINSDVGSIRESNQDSVYCGSNLLLVADGMGGHAGGDVASTITSTIFSSLDRFAAPRGIFGSRLSIKDATNLIEKSTKVAHHEIIEHVKINPDLTGMGTTLTGILRTDSAYMIFHLGDSRAYRLHDGILTQLTKDHTFVQHLIDNGKITDEEAKYHPQKNVVMRVLGDFEMDLLLDYDYCPIDINDRYFLCSDGINAGLDDEQIKQILMHESDPEKAADLIVKSAIENGSTDNCTAVVADVVAFGVNNQNNISTIKKLPTYAGAAKEALFKSNDNVEQNNISHSDISSKDKTDDLENGANFIKNIIEKIQTTFINMFKTKK